MEAAPSGHWIKAHFLSSWTMRKEAPCPGHHSDTLVLHCKSVLSIVLYGHIGDGHEKEGCPFWELQSISSLFSLGTNSDTL